MKITILNFYYETENKHKEIATLEKILHAVKINGRGMQGALNRKSRVTEAI